MTIKAFKDHPVREILSRVKSMQAAPEMAAPEIASNEDAAFARDKVFAIARALGSLLEQTPATLVNTQALSQLHLNLQTPLAELTQFLSSKNVGHLQNAASQMEQNVLPLFGAFGPKFTTFSKSDALQFLEDLRTTASQSISQLSAERDKLAGDVDALRLTIQKQEERLEALSETAAKERGEAAATVSNLERQFSEKEIERNTDFEKLLASFKVSMSAAAATTEDRATALLQKLETLRDDAARIVQVVGNIGVTGNYQQIAQTEGKQANFWRWITVIFFGAGVGIAIATFVKFYSSTIDANNFGSIAIRLLYAIAITAPAWYTARESARHRTNSDRAKQTELELASLGPFVELMPEPKQIEIREKLAASFFGRGTEPHSVNSSVDIKQIRELVVEVVKAMKP